MNAMLYGNLVFGSIVPERLLNRRCLFQAVRDELGELKQAQISHKRRSKNVAKIDAEIPTMTSLDTI